MTNQTLPPWPPVPPTFWSRRTTGQRIGLVAAALLLPCCGGLGLLGAIAGNPQPPAATKPAEAAAAVDPLAAAPAPTVTVTATPGTSATARPATSGTATPATVATTRPPSRGPVIVKRTATETRKIKFSSRTVEDSSLDSGDTEVRTAGVAGVRTRTYEVTLTDGRETARRLISDKVTRKPVTRVVAVGTRVEEPAGDCNPNYSPCVPNASDVDCAGGSGNGPEYVDGPIRVTGSDPYDLDRDGDGIACDS